VELKLLPDKIPTSAECQKVTLVKTLVVGGPPAPLMEHSRFAGLNYCFRFWRTEPRPQPALSRPHHQAAAVGSFCIRHERTHVAGRACYLDVAAEPF
jgi:hypothetical protein